MAKAKYKVGDTVNVRHVGPCVVKHVRVIKGVGTEYVLTLKKGIVIFSVDESLITEKQEAK